MQTQHTMSHIFRRIYIFILYFIIILLSIGLVGYGILSYAFSNNAGGNSFFANPQQLTVGLFDLLPVAGDALTGNKTPLQGEKEGRTNILLLGKDPEGGLTDTIMVMSYFYNTREVYTFSIPRDTFVKNKDLNGEKINGVINVISRYTTQDGRQYLRSLLEQELGIPLHYWASVDIQGLQKLVDIIGGVQVEVACTFTDYQYPAPNYRGYLKPAPTFTKGTVTLNGEQAVIYARSRKSLDCNEGSDFARSRRQAQVIQAIISKVKSQNLLENAFKAKQYIDVVQSSVETNISIQELYSFGSLYSSGETKTMSSIAFTTEDVFLCSTQSSSGAYIIVYGKGNDCGKYTFGSALSNPYKKLLQAIIAQPSLYNTETKQLNSQPQTNAVQKSVTKDSYSPASYSPFKK